jgi:hypothetical protein
VSDEGYAESLGVFETGSEAVGEEREVRVGDVVVVVGGKGCRRVERAWFEVAVRTRSTERHPRR